MAEATTTITVRIPVAIKEKLDRLAGHVKRSRSYLATEALEIYTRHELEIVEGILEAQADFDAGRFYTTEQMIAMTDDWFARRSKQASKRTARKPSTRRAAA